MGRVYRGASWLAVLLVLAGCQAKAPSPPPPEPSAPEPPAPPPPTPPRRAVSTGWVFSTHQRCTATASGRGAALEVAATDRAVVWTVRGPLVAGMRPARAVPMAFTGPTASWTLPGQRTGRGQLVATLPLAENQVGQVLLALDGGTLRLGMEDQGLTLRIANAGQAGRAWFECVRRRLLP